MTTMTCKDCLIYDKCCRDAYDESFREGRADRFLIFLANQMPCKYFKNKADVVEVVRCRNCKYFNNQFNTCKCLSPKADVEMNEDDYCSYGERKDVDNG